MMIDFREIRYAAADTIELRIRSNGELEPTGSIKTENFVIIWTTVKFCTPIYMKFNGWVCDIVVSSVFMV
jgi:hypothetical protein